MQNLIQQFRVFYKQYAIRFWVYILLSVTFIVFFSLILSNGNSRYSMRLKQSDQRIDNRRTLMQQEYHIQDSLFQAEQHSLKKLESNTGNKQ